MCLWTKEARGHRRPRHICSFLIQPTDGLGQWLAAVHLRPDCGLPGWGDTG